MDSIDRQTIASSVAVILYLLLVYGLVEELDCECEQRTEAADMPLRPRLHRETPGRAAHADSPPPAADRLLVQHTSPPARPGMQCRERFEP